MRLGRPAVAAFRFGCLLCAVLLASPAGAQFAGPAPMAGPGAIVGRILDQQSSPVHGAVVDALVIRNDRGTDMLVSVRSARTDERGEFRLADLAPGLYYVSAVNPSKEDLHYSATYAPGTAFADEAESVAVTGTGNPPRVEFRLKAAPPARVSGQLVSYDSKPLLNGAVTMTPAPNQGAPIVPPQDITIFPDGRFTFGRVAPGHYQIRARGQTASGGSALFAIFGTFVDGRDVEGILMTLRPGATMAGRLSIDAKHGATPPAFSKLTVRAPFTDGNTFGDVPTGVVERDGTFSIRGIMTGEHQIVVDGLRPPWVLKQVSQHGADVTDAPIDVAEAQQFRDVRIVVTDASSAVTGTVRDANGEPAANAGVVVFSAAPSFWMHTSRRVRVAFTGVDGHFQIIGLPAGEYLAVASRMIDESIRGRRSRLQAFASVATRLRLDTDDGRTNVDLRVTAAPPSLAAGR
jgi:hypothetical protein